MTGGSSTGSAKLDPILHGGSRIDAGGIRVGTSRWAENRKNDA